MITIALDAIGGDRAPGMCVEGAVDALGKTDDLRIVLLGPAGSLGDEIQGLPETLSERLVLIDAPEVISTDESPVRAIRKKPMSSIVIGLNMLKEGSADAFISAGSSGAILAGGQLIVGRARGVLRPPLASLMPTLCGYSLFLDCGANVDAKPEWLLQFAKMGSLYMNLVEGIENPVVKLSNVGPEEEKGDSLTKAAHELLKKDGSVNYGGFVEFRDIPCGAADVVVADAFTGNAIIKTYEGVGSVLIDSVKEVLRTNLKTKLGAALIMKELKAKLSAYDSHKCGGAMLLGLRKVVIKCHGNANSLEISTSIEKAAKFVRSDLAGAIQKHIEAAGGI